MAVQIHRENLKFEEGEWHCCGKQAQRCSHGETPPPCMLHPACKPLQEYAAPALHICLRLQAMQHSSKTQ